MVPCRWRGKSPRPASDENGDTFLRGAQGLNAPKMILK